MMQIPSTEAGPPSASWVLVDHTALEKAASEASQCLHHLGFSSGSLNNSMPTDLGKHVGYVGMRDQNTVEKALPKEWGARFLARLYIQPQIRLLERARGSGKSLGSEAITSGNRTRHVRAPKDCPLGSVFMPRVEARETHGIE